MSEMALRSARRFMVKELTSYQDELFSLLFWDISGFSQDISDDIFGQSDRRISIYGVRGLGKTTAMQGALWTGLAEQRTQNCIPVNVVVSGARGVTSLMELSDLFYRSVILGVSRVARASRLKDDLLKAADRYAPWVARKLTEVVGIFIGPVALASDLSEKGVKWLVERLGYSTIDSLIAAKDLDSQQAAALLIDRLEDFDGNPVFIIDELDKVENDTVLSDFFDGNQAWFQGKQGIISLSYTFGESLGKTLVTSASRVSRIKPFLGITSLDDAIEIVRRRVRLGLSQIEETEEAANKAAIQMMPDETIKAILNVSAPNTYVMLERTSATIDRALSSKATSVSADHIQIEPAEEATPTKLLALILQELTAGRLSPSVISDRLQRDRGQITRTLVRMMEKDWVGRIGAGKRAYYYITARGEAALRRAESS